MVSSVNFFGTLKHSVTNIPIVSDFGMNVAESPSKDQGRRDKSSGDIANIPLVDPHVRNAGGALSLPCFNTMTDPMRTLPYLAPLVAAHLKVQH